MRNARLKVSSVDLQAAAAQKVTVDGLATQQVEGTPVEESKEETKEADSSSASKQSEARAADATRFYTLNRATTQNAHVDASELTEIAGPLTVPNMQPNSTYNVTLYVRLSSPASHHVVLDLDYTNADQFELSKREQISLAAKAALAVRVKLFSERSISIPATLPPEGRSLALGDRCVLHVEVDNVSSHAVALTDVRLDLTQQGIVEVAQSTLWGGEARLTGGRLQDATALFASRHTTSCATQAECVCVPVTWRALPASLPLHCCTCWAAHGIGCWHTVVPCTGRPGHRSIPGSSSTHRYQSGRSRTE